MRVLDWVDTHASVFIIVGLLGLGALGLQVFHDEHHTRAVQIAGGPVAVCLLDVMKEVAPLLERVPTVERPLQAYVRLQSVRYPGVPCPEK